MTWKRSGCAFASSCRPVAPLGLRAPAKMTASGRVASRLTMAKPELSQWSGCASCSRRTVRTNTTVGAGDEVDCRGCGYSSGHGGGGEEAHIGCAGRCRRKRRLVDDARTRHSKAPPASLYILTYRPMRAQKAAWFEGREGQSARLTVIRRRYPGMHGLGGGKDAQLVCDTFLDVHIHSERKKRPDRLKCIL